MLEIMLSAALAAAQAATTEPRTGPSVVPLRTYHIDSRIALYLGRYTRCLEDYVAARAVQPASTKAVADLYDAALPACAEIRSRQYAAAERLLINGQRSADRELARRLVDEAFRIGDQTRNLYGEAVRRETAAQAAGSDPERSIDVPYQALPAYMIYAACVAEHFRGGGDGAEALRRANGEAIAACREVRTQQLARALSAQTDNRMYASADAARAAIRQAFDRFDRDYQVEDRIAADATATKEQ